MTYQQIINHIKNMNYTNRTLLKTSMIAILNFLIGLFKLVIGIIYVSDWIIVNALYYLILSIAKEYTLLSYKKLLNINNTKDITQYELHYLQKSSLFIGLIGLSYFFISLHHLYKPEMIHYSQYLVFIIIIISIEKILTSLWGIYKTRRIKSSHILSIKIIDFIDAVVSIIVTRSIIQSMTQHDFGIQTSGILGIVSSLLFISIAIYMYKIYKQKPL